MKLKPIDVVSLVYSALLFVLIACFRAQVRHWPWYLGFLAAYAVLIFLLVGLDARFPKNRALKFLRLTYPLLTTLAAYKSIEGYVLVLHGHFLDGAVTGLEKALLGVNPTLALERMVSRPLNEFFMFAYFSYYSFIVVPPLWLFLQRRDPELEHLVFSLILTFYVSYLGFVLLPVEGPRYALRGLYAVPELQGYVFAPLQRCIMRAGEAHGACFPSSHLAVAWVALFSIRKFFGRKPFWILLPLTVALSVSIVYNRYHYLSDAVGGMLVAWLCYQTSRRVYRRAPGADRGPTPPPVAAAAGGGA